MTKNLVNSDHKDAPAVGYFNGGPFPERGLSTGPDRVEWTGSRTCAPGPGAKVDGAWRLLGTVVRVSPADTNSIKVEWDNGRVTIERNANLTRA